MEGQLMARGSKFALGKEPSRDAQGHSLPDDMSMRFVAIDLVCSCRPRGQEVHLARFGTETRSGIFVANEVDLMGENHAVTVQSMPDRDGTLRQRYKMRCPHCTNAPVLRADKIEAAVEAIYEPGAVAKIIRYRI
jgi:hypothetical protein